MQAYVLFKSFLMIFSAEMGDKSQFLMIAMSAHFGARKLLSGTFLAVLLLNAAACALGGFLGTCLPLSAVSLIAGLAFFCFFHLALSSGGEAAEGKIRGGTVFSVFGTYFLAELGDKTQLSVLALAAEEGAGDPLSLTSVFWGATAALLLADALGVLIGYVLGKRLPKRLFSLISAFLFAACGAVRVMEGFDACFSHLPHAQLCTAVATLAVTGAFLCVPGITAVWHGRKKKGVLHGTSDTGGAKSVSQQR